MKALRVEEVRREREIREAWREKWAERKQITLVLSAKREREKSSIASEWDMQKIIPDEEAKKREEEVVERKQVLPSRLHQSAVIVAWNGEWRKTLLLIKQARVKLTMKVIEQRDESTWKNNMSANVLDVWR